MSKAQDSTEQIKFLVCCIHNATGGKPNFQAVAEQLGIVTKAAAQKRYERLLKAHGVAASTKAAANGVEESEAPPAPPKRKAAPRGAARATKKKLKKEDESAGSEDRKKSIKKEKSASPEVSDLSDLPTSADESA